MRALTTVVIAFGFVALLAQAALAEETAALTAHTEAQKRESAEVDKAYRAATRGDMGRTVNVDPWASVRPAASDNKPEKKSRH